MAFEASTDLFGYIKRLTGVLVLSNILTTSPQVVDLGYAQYQGVFDSTSNITSFHGLRYASPPIGSLRWQPPIPPINVPGLQQADSQAVQCYQAGAGAGFPPPPPLPNTVGQDEDCLFLNVFVPGTVNANNSLPVVVWIHGGGYVSDIPGSAGGDGGDFIRNSNGGVIAVVIQYRLGIFGFLAGAELKSKGALNVGLLDQRYALKWVQDHISSFGGSPSKVTIWGQSAGAGSVIQHVVADGGRTDPPLFRAAITSSTFLRQHHYNDPVPERIYAQVVNFSGCTESEDKLSCLRSMNSSALATVNKQTSLSAFTGTFDLLPVVDGELIVERPVETLRKGTVNGDVLLAVTNSFEGRIFVNESTTYDLRAYVANLFPNFNAKQVDATIAQYAKAGLDTNYDKAVGIMGEFIFICPTYFLLHAFRERGYKGEFAVPPANHGDDMGAYYPSTHPPTTANKTLIASFSQSFLAVVMSLDPNAQFDHTDRTPMWRVWNDDNPEMVFNVTNTDEAVIRSISTDPGLLERCRFWQSLASVIPQ